MKTSLQWVSTGPMLSLSLVQRLWPPTQDNGWLSALPTELCNYHHNHSQQRPHSAGCGKLRTRYLPFKASTEHCRLLKGLCQNSPLPTPLVLTPRPDPPSCTDQDGKPPTVLDTGLTWSLAAPGTRRKPSGHVLTKSDRYWAENGCQKTVPRVVSSRTCPGKYHCIPGPGCRKDLS